MDNNIDSEYPFTGDYKFDKLVLSFYIIKGLFFILTFIFCAPQIFLELKYIKKYKKKISHRLMTFISISLFLFFRAIQNFVGASIKNTHTKSLFWYVGIWGTLFLAMELVYIGMYWMSILYTFFISSSIAINNVNRTWYCANSLYIFFTFWNISLMILSKYESEQLTASVSSKGFVVMVSILGTVIIVNGIILFKYLGLQSSKSLVFRKSYQRTKRMALVIFLIVLGMVIRDIVVAIAKIARDSNYTYIILFFTFLLEYPQSIFVMYALANKENPLKNYLTFKKVTTDNVAPELPPDSNMESMGQFSSNFQHVNTSESSGGIVISSGSSNIGESNSGIISENQEIEMNNIEDKI